MRESDDHTAEDAAAQGEPPARVAPADAGRDRPSPDRDERPVEIGGRTKGLEPTRYGDWEKEGRCIDF